MRIRASLAVAALFSAAVFVESLHTAVRAERLPYCNTQPAITAVLQHLCAAVTPAHPVTLHSRPRAVPTNTCRQCDSWQLRLMLQLSLAPLVA